MPTLIGPDSPVGHLARATTIRLPATVRVAKAEVKASLQCAPLGPRCRRGDAVLVVEDN